MKEDAQQAIATAIYDHYKPESMEDSVPRTIEGAVLSISDKADSIAGMFSLGLVSGKLFDLGYFHHVQTVGIVIYLISCVC